MRHSLGEPLPHQLADIAQAAPGAINLYSSFALDSIRASEDRSCDLSFVALNEIQSEEGDHRELSTLSAGYARLRGTYLRVTTSSAVGLNPLDLHALSIPPAFTLS